MAEARALEPLLLAVAQRDRGAFRVLFDTAGPKLMGLALRICREQALAEDAVQEAFVEIWRKAEGFDPERGSAAGWMAVIARNRAIDLVRRRGRAPGWGGGGEGEDPLARLIDPFARPDGGAEAMALSECLGRLEPRPRELVMLAYVEGLSREELSARYDAPVNTIKTWLRRGLAALKTCLDG